MPRNLGFRVFIDANAAQTFADAINRAHVAEHGEQETYAEMSRGSVVRRYVAPRKPLVSVMASPDGDAWAVKVPTLAEGYRDGGRPLDLTTGRVARPEWLDND